MTDTCAAKTPVAALMIQGRLDERIPWDGGVFDGTRRPSMAEMVNRLAARNGCAAEPQTLPAEPAAQCWSRKGCTTPLQWCGLPQVGHQWAGGATYFPRVLGPNTNAFDTSARIGAFFASQGSR
jgi:polyhydroxybutyrate depolymerase